MADMQRLADYLIMPVPCGDDEGGAISAAESDFLRRVGASMSPSPRELKRLVNTYRLTRAMLRPESLRELVTPSGDGAPEYAALITQLAIVAAEPMGVARYFAALDALPAAAELPELLDGLAAAEVPPGVLRILDVYASRYPGPGAVSRLREWKSTAERHALIRPE
jgi:hypothetical protein